MRRVGGDYLVTRTSLVAIVVSWVAIAVALGWLIIISEDIQTERAARSRAVNQALTVICHGVNTDRTSLTAVLDGLIQSNLKTRLPGYQSRIGLYRRVKQQVRPEPCPTP